MYLNKIIFLLIIFFSTISSGQNLKKIMVAKQTKKEKENTIANQSGSTIKFNISDWRTTFNKSFASILGGAGVANEVGNFASFDPINGAFNFKGSIPISKVDKNVNFLSFSIKGSLLSDNSVKLFEKTKINTNTALKGEYHFFMHVHQKAILVNTASEAMYILKKDVLEKERGRKFDLVDKSKANKRITEIDLELPAQKKLVTLLDGEINKYLDTLRFLTNTVPSKLKSDSEKKLGKKILDTPEAFFLSVQKRVTENLSKLRKELIDLHLTSEKILSEKDSLTIVNRDWDQGIELSEYRRINKEAINKLEKIKDSTFIAGFTISWLTAIGSLGKSKVYMYDGAASFTQQITDRSIFDNSFGIAANIYKTSMISRKAFLINIGALYSLSNNADTLSTTDISEEYTYKNELGDITRKIITKYSTYTDKIINQRKAIIYGNFYYVFGHKASAFHWFPMFVKPNHHTGYLNSGIGYITSFKSLKKDTPILNAEFYAQLSDLFGSLSESRILQRGEAGIKFTLPFNFF